MKKLLTRYEKWLLVRVGGKSLSIFRILFGIFIAFDAWYFLTFLDVYWPAQNYYFHFPAFAWWPHFNHEINAVLFVSMAVAGLMVSVGLFTRLASAWVSLIIAHMIFIEASFYLNHLVLSFCISTVLIFIPSDRYFALQKSWSSRGDRTIARYELFSVIILFWMSYTYSAVEKMRPEWINGDIIAANMGLKKISNPIAAWLYQSNYLSAQAWIVLLIEFFAPFLLFCRRTRTITVVVLIGFHIVNHLTLDIGLFSFLMLASMVLYWQME